MNATGDLFYESQAQYSSQAIADTLKDLITQPDTRAEIKVQVQNVLDGQKVKVDPEAVIRSVSRIEVKDQGAGFDSESVRLLVSLAPFIKELVPLVQPFCNDASAVAKKIALDLWEIIKGKLSDKKKIRLRSRASV
ncbi:MAG TPA: hypothetical protein VKH81_23050 [Candidatus Angelobacter sp.]|nr:hypothetical protein [Candidatus Angelobacter sp.]